MPLMHQLFAIATLLSGTAGAAVLVQMEVDHHTAPSAGTSKLPPDRHLALQLTLAEKSFVVANDDGTTVYDFANRRRLQLDRKTQTRVEYSLYDTVVFRAFELQNRAMLARSLAAAKLGDGTAGIVDHEHSLSMQDKPSTPLQVAEAEGDRTFSDQSRVLFRASLKGTPVQPDQARMFAQSFRYMAGGHPQILTALAASNAIPERLVMTTYDVGVTTSTYTIRSVTIVDDAPVDLSAYPKRTAAADADAIDRLLDGAEAFTPAELAAAKQRNRDEQAAAFREGRVMDARLGMIEWLLMTGEVPPQLTAEQRQQMLSDPIAIKLTSALAARSRAEVTAALPVLVELAPSATDKAYLMDLFIGNDRKTLGDLESSTKLFVKVLQANPRIAGAYKDLGDALLMQWDMPRAWRCYDLGRRIAPQFANLHAVDQLEAQLVAGHPEYF